MDQLPPLGTAIADILAPTAKIYGKLLQSNAQAIHSTPRQTYKYGPHERQELDVYRPTSNTTNTILIFIHGGGLVAGGKILETIPDSLAYTNIGHFFASHYNYTVIIPNYRLIRHGAKFPSGGEDISLVLDWIRTNGTELGGDTINNEPRDVFLMGSSAGGVHSATYLLAPAFKDHRKTILSTGQQEADKSSSSSSSIRLKKAVLLHTPCAYDGVPEYRSQAITGYYGTRSHEDSVNGLLREVVESHPGGVSGLLPGIDFLCMTGTLDPEDEILAPVREFVRIWRSAGDKNEKELKTGTLVGHNHVSPVYSLGTGIEEEEYWGRALVEEFFDA